ncbi:MAG: hypothetical protein HYT39_01740 [Candidatus Sungbacteria bacterium]|nr:hypothetical protein [Candidatus Sungbacteria bacterium]
MVKIIKSYKYDLIGKASKTLLWITGSCVSKAAAYDTDTFGLGEGFHSSFYILGTHTGHARDTIVLA